MCIDMIGSVRVDIVHSYMYVISFKSSYLYASWSKDNKHKILINWRDYINNLDHL